MGATKQSTLFRGIYEFEDPSGCLISAKVPATGTVDLYADTAVLVKPHQCALFIYKGQIADILLAGTHQVKTENRPILTRLANWRFGFESPLRAELIFVGGHILTARRWGTSRPILVNFEGYGPVPVRAYGNFNVAVKDPKKFYLKLMGSRSAYSIADLDEFIQAHFILGTRLFWVDGESVMAIPHLETCVRLHPSFLRAWGCLGAIYKKLGNTQLAKMAFEKCAGIETNSTMKEYFLDQAKAS